jgi:hypothetical protein
VEAARACALPLTCKKYFNLTVKFFNDLVTQNISACRKIDNTLLIKALFHGKGPTSLRVMVSFVNASAKTHTVKSIKFRPHLVM